MSYKLLFEGDRVQISTEHGGIWLSEGDALLMAHALTERLTIPSYANPRITYERGFGPGDGDSRVIDVAPSPEGCSCKSYPHTCHGSGR